MRIPSIIKIPLLTGAVLGSLHLSICLLIFFYVQTSSDGQAGFGWFPMFAIDWPSAQIAFDLFGNNRLMTSLTEWWYGVGQSQGPNLRALLLFGIFGTAQWFAVGMILSKFTSWLFNLFQMKFQPRA